MAVLFRIVSTGKRNRAHSVLYKVERAGVTVCEGVDYNGARRFVYEEIGFSDWVQDDGGRPVSAEIFFERTRSNLANYETY